MIGLALFFGFGIFMNANTFAAIYGRQARELGLAGAGLVPSVPWVSLGFYGVAVFGLTRIPLRKFRWIGFIIITVVANGLSTIPIWVVSHGSITIPVSRRPSKESGKAFDKAYGIRWMAYSSSSEGAVIRVRREDYSKEIDSFAKSLIDRQIEP